MFYVGSVGYSVVNIKYKVRDASINPVISVTGFPPEYTGYVTISTPVTIENDGFYIIKELQIDVQVISTDSEISINLNGIEIANGANPIGTISSGETWSGNIEVNITNNIPNFALEDCTLLIEGTISLIYQPLIDIPLSFMFE